MSYRIVATVAGQPQVRPNGDGGPDRRDRGLVEVARNTLTTKAADVVRVTVTGLATLDRSAYLDRVAVEELAAALLRAADLNPDEPQPAPNVAGGGISLGGTYAPRTADRALLAIEAAVRESLHAGASVSAALAAVANGITGEVNGPRERALAKALTTAAEAP